MIIVSYLLLIFLVRHLSHFAEELFGWSWLNRAPLLQAILIFFIIQYFFDFIAHVQKMNGYISERDEMYVPSTAAA